MWGMFKFSHAAVAVAAVFVMSLGLVAAAGSGMLDGGSNTVSFNARAIVTDATLSFVQREDDQSYVYLRFDNSTRFEDASGAPITWAGIARESRIFVEATPPATGRFFDTHLVRLIGTGSTPTPSANTASPTRRRHPRQRRSRHRSRRRHQLRRRSRSRLSPSRHRR